MLLYEHLLDCPYLLKFHIVNHLTIDAKKFLTNVETVTEISPGS